MTKEQFEELGILNQEYVEAFNELTKLSRSFWDERIEGNIHYAEQKNIINNKENQELLSKFEKNLKEKAEKMNDFIKKF